MIQMLGAVAPLAKILFNTIEKSVPDKDLQEKLKAQLQTQLLQSNTAELQAAAKIVEAEAKAGWFSASWRPLLMYVLIFILIWNYVLGPVILFFFKASITITLPGDVWTLLQIGLGGYVVGEAQNRWHALWQINRQTKNKKTDRKKMRNDYKIRPRPGFKMGGKAKKGFPDLNKDGKTTYADIITARMSKSKKGKMMKGKK
jgi:hypothetical protein